jgi:TRAP-type mannitol/chloroaromatic compound transport system permease small subunit
MQQSDDLIKLSDPGEVGRAEHNRGDRVSVAVSNVFAWLFPILMLAICSQVVLRTSGFNQAWLDDLQWWLYGSSALMAIGYAVTTNSHVRVDIFHENFSERKKTRIEIFALAWLFLPFIILSWDITVPYALQSIQNDEGSSSPNGLHNLWILKTFMNLAFIFIAFATWAAYVRFLSKLVKPTLWRQLLYALPSTIFLVNLVVYYVIWWVLRLTTPAEVSDRDIGRHWLFETFEIGPEEMKWTVLFALIGTVILIGAARALDRSGASET